jgi:opacity protein-like surface antigen
MEFVMKHLLFCLTFLFSSSVVALDYSPYVGFEGKLRYQRFAQKDGRKNIENIMPEMGLMGGLKFHDNFGVEVGAHMGLTRATPKSKVQHDVVGCTVTAVAFYPIWDDIESFIGLGINHARSEFLYLGSPMFKLQKAKVIMRGLVGFQYNLADNIILRNSYSIENTSKLKIQVDDAYIKPKNDLNAHLGLIYTF